MESKSAIYPYIKLRQNLDKYLEKNIFKRLRQNYNLYARSFAKTLKKIHSSKIEFIPHCTDLELHNKKQKKNY